MLSSDFDYDLPEGLIAQFPAVRREQSRLLVLQRQTGAMTHYPGFSGIIDHLQPGDLLVANNSRVIPARLRGVNQATGGQFEVLLLSENERNDWWAMLRPGKRGRIGTRILLKDARGGESGITAIVQETNAEGHRRLRFEGTANILDAIDALGEVPLPPYIVREPGASRSSDRERYQTVFAQPPGSVAAPTAGLHFSEALLQTIGERGVELCFVTLHVGLGTFAPVKAEKVSAHVMHEERFEVSEAAARSIERARGEGRRIVAVGTTTLRLLESVAAQNEGRVVPGPGRTRIFIYPPFQFRVVSALLTNFHLPRSTLLMLVSAFAAPGATGGRELVLRAYFEAVREGYRFFSYGDAMLLL